jgi:signal transduction histidine kinase
MRWQPWIAFVALLIAFAGLAAWQWDEYGRECELARRTVANSADSVMNALVGGVRSHRRLGLFFSEQVQGVLEGLVQAEAVRAAAVVSEDGRGVLSAGDARLLNLASPLAEGGYWDEAGYRLVSRFRLPADSSSPGGPGSGRGWGRRWQTEDENTAGPFDYRQPMLAILVMDRSGADAAIRRAAWTRGSIVAAGWSVVLCVALMWLASVRLAEARGKARTLEMEARYFRDLSQAAAGLAHETRNPLALIRGWTQRLADSGANCADGRRQAQAIIEECDRLTARINQFLAFARPSEPKLERLDPAELIEQLAALLEPDLSAKNLTLARPTTGCQILADRELLRQALFNLLQNAVQASAENQIIHTTVICRRDGRVRIEVADCGPGVSPEASEKLFMPYFTTRAGGTGLGLAIVRRIAAAHGWEVGYTPRSGGGAIFWLDGIHGR